MSDTDTTDGATETVAPDADNEAQVWATVTGQDRDDTPAEDDAVDDNQEADAEDAEDEPADKASSTEDDGGDGQDADEQRPDQTDFAEKEKRYRGTISAKDRTIRELKQKIASFQDAANEERGEDDQIETIEALREEYPDLLDPILKRLDALRADQDGIRQQLGAVSQYHSQELQHDAEQQVSYLSEQMPDWNDLVNDNAEAFWDWVDDQPKADRELAESSQDAIQDGEAMVALLNRFKAHLEGDAHQQQEEQSSTPKRGVSASRRLAGAQTVASRGSQSAASRPQPDETDDVAIWQHITKND